MPIMASIDNPLGNFRNGAIASADGKEWPIPLASTRIDVTIRGGLAIVTTERLFRNTETRTIEATMTFPVPVDATLCALSARIDGRTLQAVAQPRGTARKSYEDAIDRGHATVLHEELLRGVHMLSVGQVQPDAEIAVTATWTAPLSFIDDTPRLRIPVTVGDIYGRSPLAAADDLVAGGAVQEATVGIVCDDGTATLLGAGVPKDGRHTVSLDHPIDIAVSGFTPRLLRGVAADGREVVLTIEPLAKAAAPLVVDVLFDHSGSMTEQASGNPEITGTKFERAKAGLLAIARSRITSADRVQLWEFNDNVVCLGQAQGTGIEALVHKLSDATGGTEIGRAFDAVAASSIAHNVVIITDGKSWAFDPQHVARRGLRVTAVLIGEDSLEGGVADLAGMTGGQVFVAAGSDAGAAIAAALEAARVSHHPSPPIEGQLSRVEAFRRGGHLVANWGAAAAGTPAADARLIGATAAMLAIPLLQPAAAADLAGREGIVCHLTSLVLVDETGAAHAGVPATRKVVLSAPRTAMAAAARMPAAACYSIDEPPARAPAPARRDDSLVSGWSHLVSGIRGRSRRVRSPAIDGSPVVGGGGAPVPPAPRSHVDLSRVLGQIDWNADPDTLRRGDLQLLPSEIAVLIREAARLPAIDALAWAAGLDPVVAVIAILAKAAAKSSRTADRLARNLLHSVDADAVTRAMSEVGLRSLSLAP